MIPPGNLPHPLVQQFQNIMPMPPPTPPPQALPPPQPPSPPVEKHEKGGLEISLVADIQKSYLSQHAQTAPANSQNLNANIGAGNGAMAPQPGWGGRGR